MIFLIHFISKYFSLIFTSFILVFFAALDLNRPNNMASIIIFLNISFSQKLCKKDLNSYLLFSKFCCFDSVSKINFLWSLLVNSLVIFLTIFMHLFFHLNHLYYRFHQVFPLIKQLESLCNDLSHITNLEFVFRHRKLEWAYLSPFIL